MKNAKVLLLNAALEYKKTEVNAKINISRPDQVQAFVDEDEQMVHTMADKIAASGATVVFCQKGIDDTAQHYLAKAGIFAARRVKKSDIENLARATGAAVVNSIDAITAGDLGTPGHVEEKKLSGQEMIYVSGCKNPKAVSIIIRGGSEHVIDELERGMHDALMVVSDVVKDTKIVAGGGAPETEPRSSCGAMRQLSGGVTSSRSRRLRRRSDHPAFHCRECRARSHRYDRGDPGCA